MAKKEFFSSFEKNLSLESTATAQKGRATSKKGYITNITKKVQKANITDIAEKEEITKVTTFRVNVEHLEKIKAIAYWERSKIQDVFNNALSNYIDGIPKKELDQAVKAFKK